MSTLTRPPPNRRLTGLMLRAHNSCRNTTTQHVDRSYGGNHKMFDNPGCCV